MTIDGCATIFLGRIELLDHRKHRAAPADSLQAGVNERSLQTKRFKEDLVELALAKQVLAGGGNLLRLVVQRIEVVENLLGSLLRRALVTRKEVCDSGKCCTDNSNCHRRHIEIRCTNKSDKEERHGLGRAREVEQHREAQGSEQVGSRTDCIEDVLGNSVGNAGHGIGANKQAQEHGEEHKGAGKTKDQPKRLGNAARSVALGMIKQHLCGNKVIARRCQVLQESIDNANGDGKRHCGFGRKPARNGKACAQHARDSDIDGN